MNRKIVLAIAIVAFIWGLTQSESKLDKHIETSEIDSDNEHSGVSSKEVESEAAIRPQTFKQEKSIPEKTSEEVALPYDNDSPPVDVNSINRQELSERIMESTSVSEIISLLRPEPRNEHLLFNSKVASLKLENFQYMQDVIDKDASAIEIADAVEVSSEISTQALESRSSCSKDFCILTALVKDMRDALEVFDSVNGHQATNVFLKQQNGQVVSVFLVMRKP